MIGRRRQPDQYGWFNDKLYPGDYVRVAPTAMADGSPLPSNWAESMKAPYWMCCSPNGHVANLGNHEVTEHEDGTITVKPSIVLFGPGGKECWHGMLEKGVYTTLPPTGRQGYGT